MCVHHACVCSALRGQKKVRQVVGEKKERRDRQAWIWTEKALVEALRDHVAMGQDRHMVFSSARDPAWDNQSHGLREAMLQNRTPRFSRERNTNRPC